MMKELLFLLLITINTIQAQTSKEPVYLTKTEKQQIAAIQVKANRDMLLLAEGSLNVSQIKEKINLINHSRENEIKKTLGSAGYARYRKEQQELENVASVADPVKRELVTLKYKLLLNPQQEAAIEKVLRGHADNLKTLLGADKKSEFKNKQLSLLMRQKEEMIEEQLNADQIEKYSSAGKNSNVTDSTRVTLLARRQTAMMKQRYQLSATQELKVGQINERFYKELYSSNMPGNRNRPKAPMPLSFVLDEQMKSVLDTLQYAKYIQDRKLPIKTNNQQPK